MGKRRFSYLERYAIWHRHGRQCWQCQAPLRLIETTIDHVLPESLLDDDRQREAILKQYGLPEDFNINGFENWLPCHNHCNQRKGATPPAFIPGHKVILDRLLRLAPDVERLVHETKSSVAKEKVFATIFAALEERKLSVRDLHELLDGFLHEPAKAGVPEDVIVLDSGYWFRKDELAREGLCLCERTACVGSTQKIYCYFPHTLGKWVIDKGLFWGCYDEVITCPRCFKEHKRGHIGREQMCGRPYMNQETQTDRTAF